MKTQNYFYVLLVVVMTAVFCSCSSKSKQMMLLRENYPFYEKISTSGILISGATDYSFSLREDYNLDYCLVLIIQSQEKDSSTELYPTILFKSEGSSRNLETAEIGYTEIEEPTTFLGETDIATSYSEDFPIYEKKFKEALSILDEKLNKQKELQRKQIDKIVTGKEEPSKNH